MPTTEEALVSVTKSQKHNIQQEIWRRDIKSLNEQNDERVEDVQKLRSDFYKISGICLIFQGVILTAVAQSSRLSCSQAWSPVALSAAVALAALLEATDKIVAIAEGELEFQKSNERITNHMKALDDLDNIGIDLDIQVCKEKYGLNESEEEEEEEVGSDSEDGEITGALSGYVSEVGLRKILSLTYLCVLIFLVTISVVVEVVSYKALCDSCQPCAARR